jgi:hypothetical protein
MTIAGVQRLIGKPVTNLASNDAPILLFLAVLGREARELFQARRLTY